MKRIAALTLSILPATAISTNAAFELLSAKSTPTLAENLAVCSGKLAAGVQFVGTLEIEQASEETNRALRFMLKTVGNADASAKVIAAANQRSLSSSLLEDPMNSRRRMASVLTECNGVLDEARVAYSSEATRVRLAAEAKAEEVRRSKIAFDTEQQMKRLQAKSDVEKAKQASINAEADAKVRAETAHQTTLRTDADAKVRIEEAKAKAETARQLAVKAEADAKVKLEEAKAKAETARKATLGAEANSPAVIKVSSDDLGARAQDTANAAKVSTQPNLAQKDGQFRTLVKGSQEKKDVDNKIADYVDCSEYFVAGITIDPTAVKIVQVMEMAKTLEAMAFYTAKPHYAIADVWQIQAQRQKNWENMRNIDYWLFTEDQYSFCVKSYKDLDQKTRAAALANFADMNKVIVLK